MPLAPAARSQHIGGTIFRRLMKPGAQGLEFRESRSPLRQGQEHGLCCVFGEGTISKPAQANGVKPARVPFDELTKGCFGSLCDKLLDKLAVLEHRPTCRYTPARPPKLTQRKLDAFSMIYK